MPTNWPRKERFTRQDVVALISDERVWQAKVPVCQERTEKTITEFSARIDHFMTYLPVLASCENSSALYRH